MKRVAALLFLFGCAAMAQVASKNHPATPSPTAARPLTVIVPAPQADYCPVGLQAKHGMEGFTREVNGEVLKDLAQMVHLVVTDPDARRVVSAIVSVHGLTDKGRLVQTQSNLENGSSVAESGADATRTVEIHFTPGADKEQTASVRLPGLSAVMSIELKSVTYNDGSTWKMDANRVCRAEVDPLMLVDLN